MTTDKHAGLGALGAGGVIGLLGATSIGIALFAPDTPALEVGLIFAAAALVELVAGVALHRHGGAGLSPLFSGASGLAVVAMLFFYWWIVPQSRSASTVTMLFGIFCVSTAIARVLDLAFDRPVASLSESIAAMTSLAVGIIALSWWNEASVFLSAWLVGVELLATALAVSGAAWAHWVHPDQSGYEDPLPH
ncbi:MAG: hypothetical protein JNM17_34855 [Archangium sp.]|nr:hypothetical protein [Archangium sp.]